MDNVRIVEMCELRAQGWTYAKIGLRFGLSRQRVMQIIARVPYHIAKHLPELPTRANKRGRPLSIVPYQKKLQQKIKAHVLTHYGNGKLACVFCGFTDLRALSIDHMDSKGYADQHGGGLYARLIKNDFPLGFQTLCMNCQWIKRHILKETRGGGKRTAPQSQPFVKGKKNLVELNPSNP